MLMWVLLLSTLMVDQDVVYIGGKGFNASKVILII